MKQPWNLFCQKAPPCLYPIFHSSNDPDISANAVGWRSVHGWQRKKKPQLILNFGILKVNCSLLKEKNSLQQLQQTCQWNLKLIIWDKLLTLNISALKLMCSVAVFWKVRSTTGWMEASPVSAPHLTSVPWPTHLSYGQNKVLLQPPPLWITSPSGCVHKTQYTKQRVAEKSTPTPLCLWYNAD